MLVHLFRLADGMNHAVLSEKKKPKRNGTHSTICDKTVSEDAKRIAPRIQGDHEKAAVIGCDVCLDGTTL